MALYFCNFFSPIGTLYLLANDQALMALSTTNDVDALGQATFAPEQHILQQTCSELTEYFAGQRHQFSVALAPHGTAFQQRAWQALTDIPYGQTRSYLQQAHMIGQAKAVRAVGGANGKNPILILIPCHRVIAANGKLGGFSSGLEKKEFLLQLEQVLL